MMGPLVGLLLGLLPAFADPTPDEPEIAGEVAAPSVDAAQTPPAPPDPGPEAPASGPTLADAPESPRVTLGDRPRKPYVWGGIGLPTFNYNSTNKLGFGAGAEIYDRKRGETYGYRYRLSASTFWTTSGNYGSNYLQLERRGEHFWLMRFTWRLWRNMVYVGAGGDDVSVANGDEAFGNTVNGPSFLTNVIRRVRNSPIQLWAQGYARYTITKADPGGTLDLRQPFGVRNGFYFDAGGGMSLHEVDRWPNPNRGVRAELSLRAGGTASDGRFEPLIGVNAEVMAWYPVAGEWLVLGARSLFDKTWGERPFWEQEFLGGQLRDETAYEQMLTGYARSRSRGDGVWATMVEVRPKFGRTTHPVADVGFYASLFAESAFLFDKGRLGPHLPSVGVAPLFVWQGSIELRPFISWGWLSDVPGGQRTPRPQVGISLLGAM